MWPSSRRRASAGSRTRREYLETVSRFYDLPLEHLTGSLRFLEKLVSGPHDEEFIVVEPGDELDESRFWALSGRLTPAAPRLRRRLSGQLVCDW